MTTRLALPHRRNHITQKVRIAGQRTLYLSVDDDVQPAEIILRLKGCDCSTELIGLYDVIARLLSLSLQYGAPIEYVGDLLAGTKSAPFSPVSWHNRIESCASLPDLIGRHRLVEYCGRHEHNGGRSALAGYDRDRHARLSVRKKGNSLNTPNQRSTASQGE